MPTINLVILIFSLLLLIFVVDLVRRKHLREKYSLIWIFVVLVMVVLAGWKNALIDLANFFHVYYPPSLAFLISILFLILLTLALSVIVSHQTTRIIRLIQEIGLLDERIRKLESDKNTDQKPVKPKK